MKKQRIAAALIAAMLISTMPQGYAIGAGGRQITPPEVQSA